MKHLLAISFILCSITGISQSYGDSSITLTITQSTTYWVGQYIKTQFTWSERNAPSQLRTYVSSGANPDSVIVGLTFKSKYLLGALEGLISQPLAVSYRDYRSIVLGAPAIPGYTSLVTQINAKANNPNDPQQQVAIWMRDAYQTRIAAFDALYLEQKNGVIIWSRE